MRTDLRTLLRAPCRRALAIALLGVVNAQAQDSATPTNPALEARLGAELRATVAALVESGAFGATPSERIHLDLAVPAQRVSDLGLLVDSADSHRDGVRVLGVTPGEQAEKMGVRSGDLVVAANGTPLAQREHAATTLRGIVDALPDRGELSLDVVRDGRTLSLHGTVTSRALPPMRLVIGDDATTAAAPVAATPDPTGCGRISDFDVAPRQQQLHAARVLSIDGRAAGPTNSHVFRVDAGAHTLEVGERIDARYLPFNDRQRQAGAQPTGSKTLHVDVPANTTLLVAARLNTDKAREWQHAAYWDPVVWKSVSEGCR